MGMRWRCVFDIHKWVYRDYTQFTRKVRGVKVDSVRAFTIRECSECGHTERLKSLSEGLAGYIEDWIKVKENVDDLGHEGIK